MIGEVISVCGLALRRLGRKRILYVGWAGKGNFGDDIMFEAAQRMFDTSLEPIQSVPRETFLAHLGLSGPKKFKLAILGGGTLINASWAPFGRSVLEQGVPISAIGTGAGSHGMAVKSELLDPDWKIFLREFKYIGVRGPCSAEKLRSAGIDGVTVVGDLALALTPEKPVFDVQSKQVIVNLLHAKHTRDREELAPTLEAITECARALATEGWSVQPVAFDRADLEPLKAMSERLDIDVGVEQPKTYDEYLAIARRSSLSIGMRLHSSVLATSVGMPNVLVEYREKCRDFAASVDNEESLVSMHDISADSVLEKVRHCIASSEALSLKLHQAALDKRRSIEQFAVRILSSA